MNFMSQNIFHYVRTATVDPAEQKKSKERTNSKYQQQNLDRSTNSIDNNFVGVPGKYLKDDKNKHPNHISQNQYQFTPEEIKFDNKHYKYLKYTSYKAGNGNPKSDTGPIKFEDKHKYRSYQPEGSNNVGSSGSSSIERPPIKSNKIGPNKFNYKSSTTSAASSPECKPQQLTAIGNRLLDWFSVIMADSKKRRQHSQKSKGHFPPTCKMEAKWMFGHLDLNNDGLLSAQELYDLEHDQNEQCIKPFIHACFMNQDATMNPREWCRCFEKTDRPCAAVRRRLLNEMVGTYAPDCDVQGFYKPTQCHNSVGVCWCVDKHGVEFANTRTRAKPNCGKWFS